MFGDQRPDDNQIDGKIKKLKLFSRYMDDTILDIKRKGEEGKLKELNSLHPSLKFTIEEEDKMVSYLFWI